MFICLDLDIDGLCGDLVINCVVKVLCVFEGWEVVEEEDLICVMFLCLCYCLCKDFLEIIDFGEKI